MAEHADITGRRSGRLIAQKFVRIKTTAAGCVKQLWLCECTCGNTRIVTNVSLLSGKIRSCGCANEKDRKLRNWKLRQARVHARTARARGASVSP